MLDPSDIGANKGLCVVAIWTVGKDVPRTRDLENLRLAIHRHSVVQVLMEFWYIILIDVLRDDVPVLHLAVLHRKAFS